MSKSYRALSAALCAGVTVGCSLSAPDETDFFGEPGLLRPQSGTYTLTGTLTQSLDAPVVGADQRSFGPRFLATVTHLPNDCWKFRTNSGVNVDPDYWEEYTFCSAAGGVEKSAQDQYLRWTFESLSLTRENTTSITCSPPNAYIRASMTPGETWTQFCTGSNSETQEGFQTAGPYSYVGPEQVQVAGSSVDTRHFKEVRTVSGVGYSGTVALDWWFRASDALPIKGTRSVTVTTTVEGLGSTTFTETADWVAEATQLAPL